jgi:hypothetical protein
LNDVPPVFRKRVRKKWENEGWVEIAIGDFSEKCAEGKRKDGMGRLVLVVY